MKKNVLSILDVEDQIEEIIDLGIQLKQDVKAGRNIRYLEGKTLVMIFERASTRTRVSFEVGMTLLGGHAIFLTGAELGIGKRESAKDVALVLSRYADGIMYRAVDERNLQELAMHATIPVINGLDRFEHPCQILADLMTIKEKKGRLHDLDFVFIGDGDDNLTHSYLLGCSSVGMNVTVISPKRYWPKEDYVLKSREIAAKKNHRVTITDNITAVAHADVVATDTWVSFWYDDQRAQRLADLKKYTITPEVMNKAKPDAIFMHCMPIYYGEEVTKDVAYGPQSVIIDEAENRMWAQMALLVKQLQ
ncbi:MAG: ornithine carbamoyltransferase [Thermoplasmata archaeon M9B2D]|nr:MAG: ornithine carbamoyltransferase [Thermoplasmata archaeon M9B2D]